MGKLALLLICLLGVTGCQTLQTKQPEVVGDAFVSYNPPFRLRLPQGFHYEGMGGESAPLYDHYGRGQIGSAEAVHHKFRGKDRALVVTIIETKGVTSGTEAGWQGGFSHEVDENTYLYDKPTIDSVSCHRLVKSQLADKGIVVLGAMVFVPFSRQAVIVNYYKREGPGDVKEWRNVAMGESKRKGVNEFISEFEQICSGIRL